MTNGTTGVPALTKLLSQLTALPDRTNTNHEMPFRDK